MFRVALIALFSAFAVSLLYSQSPPTEESLFLPEAQVATGVVVDSSGQPIGGALIENLGGTHKDPETDSHGQFSVSTQAPSFVIRKDGYNGAFVHTKDAKSIRVVLEASRDNAPSCPANPRCAALGPEQFFCFPMIPPGVKVSKKITDVDYVQRYLYVKTSHGNQGISYGSGLMWSFGIPFDDRVWSSVEYSERSYSAGRATVTDARGKTAAGKYWRYVGKFGESASYYDLDHESAVTLDKVLDGMCIMPQKNP